MPRCLTVEPEKGTMAPFMSGAGARPAVPIVTLDGWSGCGKSTLARDLARRLGWTYLDSGAWYRALSWAVLRAGADPEREDQVLDVLFRTRLQGEPGGAVQVDGAHPGAQLRTPALDRAVARVADHPRVRAALNERMRATALHAGLRGLVADGRDAGSVIFPEAKLKVFVAASLEQRAQRRAAQRAGDQPVSAAQLAEVLAALSERDQRDAARGASAPRPDPSGRTLDNDSLTVEEALGRLLAWIRERFPDQMAHGPATSPESP